MPSGQKTKTQNIKWKPYCNKLHKDLKMVHIKTILKKKKKKKMMRQERLTELQA